MKDQLKYKVGDVVRVVSVPDGVTLTEYEKQTMKKTRRGLLLVALLCCMAGCVKAESIILDKERLKLEAEYHIKLK